MNKLSITIGLIAIILLVGVVYVGTTSKPVVENSGITETALPETTDMITQQPEQNTMKEFVIDGANYSYTPNSIQVKKGDNVKIVFKNIEGLHDFVLDEFQIKSKQLKVGQEETIEFVADKVGTFEYYCSVGTHRQMGMKGVFEVQEL